MGSLPGASKATQAVLPPYRRVAAPATGVAPRTPKKVTFSKQREATPPRHPALDPQGRLGLPVAAPRASTIPWP